MPVELKVPAVGESITEVEIGEWLKTKGDYIAQDEPVVEIESDKATVELPAPVGGIVTEILKESGDTATVGEVIGLMEEAEAPKSTPEPGAAPAPEPTKDLPTEAPETPGDAPHVMPAAKRALADKGLKAEDVKATGPGGRLLKEDVLQHAGSAAAPPKPAKCEGTRGERVVRMSPMRRRIAERLLEIQRSAALLTTFNEIDLGAVKDVRTELQEEFQGKYGVKLGFMSFFVRACVEALEKFPTVNAEIRGEDVVYHDFCDIGIAVSNAKGLVVPVLRNAEAMDLADIEQSIADFGARAKTNKIGLDELEGGTFTITNGGVFGSLMSTPIVNPPQSAILGMHAIQDRPVARDGQVVIRPMMYVAVTYDHRIIDGREAVSFLKTIKESIEKPLHLLLRV
ncbi:MAG: 2-oxoglutarate dehydrogenase complex dihydrolipoyllysine-residue succinyltransferase [bacterium]|nr:2-oxoglutarate dehydrogenase complex dihydrolipoyllysine-residue succinyltransferase [bacterium]